ncbi:hypothetical protein J6590_055729 [Homalodisca vitripennis]|nr:hypothetical protein J6590_055729 [Homalodisca vitripennis]
MAHERKPMAQLTPGHHSHLVNEGHLRSDDEFSCRPYGDRPMSQTRAPYEGLDAPSRPENRDRSISSDPFWLPLEFVCSSGYTNRRANHVHS